MYMRIKALRLSLVIGFASLALLGFSPAGTGGAERYATDAYPGFDDTDEETKPEKKSPRWFAWWNGPRRQDAAMQFAWCQEREQAQDFGAAAKGYDALVRQWPVSPEAAPAQLRLAELKVALGDYEDAFDEYRYLLDFYSSKCDYDAVALKMYKLVEFMRQEGKTVIFFRFRNSTDVRRCYESLIFRAPGARFAPKAMLTIAELREEEGMLEKAIAVYENLRNRFPGSAEAAEACYREAKNRMALLEKLGYNRTRVADTLAFLQLNRRYVVEKTQQAEFAAWIEAAMKLLDDESWRAASFYDSDTRTRRSAIGAYERYLFEFPKGLYAAEAASRLAALKEK